MWLNFKHKGPIVHVVLLLEALMVLTMVHAQNTTCPDEEPEEFSLCQVESQHCPYKPPFDDPLCGRGCNCLFGSWSCGTYCQQAFELVGCPDSVPMANETCIIGGANDDCLYADPKNPNCTVECSCPSGTFSCKTSCEEPVVVPFIPPACPETLPNVTVTACQDGGSDGAPVCQYVDPTDSLCFYECTICPSGDIACALACAGLPPQVEDSTTCPESLPTSTDVTCDFSDPSSSTCRYDDPSDQYCSYDCLVCGSGAITCVQLCEDGASDLSGPTCPDTIPADTEAVCVVGDGAPVTTCRYTDSEDSLCFYSCNVCASGAVTCGKLCSALPPEVETSCPDSRPDDTSSTCDASETSSTTCRYSDPDDQYCAYDCFICTTGAITCLKLCAGTPPVITPEASCPETLPSITDTACVEGNQDDASTLCKYVDTADALCWHECNVCDSGAISCDMICAGQPPQTPPICPESLPTDTDSPCDVNLELTFSSCPYEDPSDQFCSYDCFVCASGAITCAKKCEGTPPVTPSCPDTLPGTGSSCTTEDQVCTYQDIADSSCASTCSCMSGSFSCTKTCATSPPTMAPVDVGMGGMSMNNRGMKMAMAGKVQGRWATNNNNRGLRGIKTE